MYFNREAVIISEAHRSLPSLTVYVARSSQTRACIVITARMGSMIANDNILSSNSVKQASFDLIGDDA